MRRVAWIAAALAAAACGTAPQQEAAPLDRFDLPTGLAVQGGKLLVVSSNGDLRWRSSDGGALFALDPQPARGRIVGAQPMQSFGGDLAVADPVECGTAIPAPLALVATRGSSRLYAMEVGPAGSLACDGCDVALSGPFADPLPVAVACRQGAGARASAFVGYLRGVGGAGWVTQLDLATRRLHSFSIGAGPVRGFAYDASRDRLWTVGLATATPTPLRYVELGGCAFGEAPTDGGCSVVSVPIAGLPGTFEWHGVAVAHPVAGAPQRLYLSGRRYDAAAAVTAQGRVGDYGGILAVVDVVDNARGTMDAQLVSWEEIGLGAADVRVLPARGAGKRDVVVALSVDDDILWIYDDQTMAIRGFGRPAGPGATGAPPLGHEPYGLAVDPDLVNSVARVYVGSYRDGYVTPVDVHLDDPELTTTGARLTGGAP